MTEDSLKELEKRYQENKGSSVEDLEDVYQEHRVFKSGEPISARITHVGVGDQVLIEITLSENNKIILGFDSEIDDMLSLLRIFEIVDVKFNPNLDVLIGESLELQFTNEQMNEISMDRGNIVKDVLEQNKDINLPDNSRLPSKIPESIKRLNEYELRDEIVFHIPIESADYENGFFLLQLDLLGIPARWKIPVPDEQNLSGTRFETVVEEVGHGSVRQVAEGSVYGVREKQLSDPAVEPSNSIGQINDWKVTWVLFPTKGDAEISLKSHNTATAATPSNKNRSKSADKGHTVPRSKAKPFFDVLEQNESVHYVGRGATIKVNTETNTDKLSSLTGVERIGLTNRRVILKSSKLTGDRTYTLRYDEIEDAELKTGIISNKFALYTSNGKYGIRIYDDKDLCIEMIEYIESKIH